MSAEVRRYREEDDYWRIRAFLRHVMLLNEVQERSWHVARLDYWRWHGILNQGDGSLEADVFLWETEDGQIVAVLNREAPGNAYLQVHPHLSAPEVEDEMIALAEEQLAIRRTGRQFVSVWAQGDDEQRAAILKRHGFTRSRWVEHQWRRDLDTPVPEASIPPGYTVRALGGPEELPARSWATWRGFHPDAPDEEYQGWAWYRNLQRCPLYRRDLDLVAVAPDGKIASVCTLWYDDVTRSAYVEPVATVPEHQRLGLARATITEGLRRVRQLGATRAFVGGYEPAANALYASVLSAVHDRSEQWVKTW